MTIPPKKAALHVVVFLSLILLAACADSLTGPRAVAGKRSSRDTIPPDLSDTLNCRQGYTIIFGRVVCGEQ